VERLQNVVFPSAELRDHPDLFYRRQQVVERTADGRLQTTVRLAFDTYMNALAIRKWRKYTEAGDLFLCLRFSGRARVSIHAGYLHSRRRSETRLLISHELASDGEGYCEIALPEDSDASMLYFEIDHVEGERFELFDAYFGTTAAAPNRVKIAIVTCTYRREAFVAKNRERFLAFLEEDPQRRKAFHWYVVDNGRTLPPTFEAENIRLFPNKNAGGAGGFTRGMLEALRADEGFTHVLLMDDDVDLFTESFARTYSLMRYVKPEHRGALVGGSMFATDEPATIYETLTLRRGPALAKLHGDLDAEQFHDVLLNDRVPGGLFETPEANVNSPWWYCCIPLDIVRRQGLPLPLFVRYDDVEYSWRNRGQHQITLNGICVWHEPFDRRVNPLTHYYFVTRNAFIANAIHHDDYASGFVRSFMGFFKQAISLYDYQSAELILLAMQDILRGPDCLRDDPRAIFERLRRVPVPPTREIAPGQEGPFFHADLELGTRWRWLNKLTLGGLLAPRRLFRPDEGFCVGQTFLPREAFAMRQRVHALNAATGQCSIREFHRGKILRLTLRFFLLLWKIQRRYGRLRDRYRQAMGEMTSAAFWESYLDLAPAGQPPREETQPAAAA